MFVVQGEMAATVNDLVAGHAVDLVMPYISLPAMQDLLDLKPRGLRLVTQVVPRDVAVGVMSLDALSAALAAGATIKVLGKGHRLHAKVLLSDSSRALVGSANLTLPGMHTNVEAGVLLSGPECGAVCTWFGELWRGSSTIDQAFVEEARRRSASIAPPPPPPPGWEDPLTPENHVRTALKRRLAGDVIGAPVFVWNSNRKHSKPTKLCEDYMLKADIAAAWTTFGETGTARKVKRGDLVLLYAKGGHLIAIGQARGPVRVVAANTERRFVGEPDSERWEVGVDWTPFKHPVGWKNVRPPSVHLATQEALGSVLEDVLRALP